MRTEGDSGGDTLPSAVESTEAASEPRIGARNDKPSQPPRERLKELEDALRSLEILKKRALAFLDEASYEERLIGAREDLEAAQKALDDLVHDRENAPAEIARLKEREKLLRSEVRRIKAGPRIERLKALRAKLEAALADADAHEDLGAEILEKLGGRRTEE